MSEILNTLWARLRRNEDGGATVEYVLVFIPLMSLLFFTFELAVGYHFTLSATKATAEGARMAAVLAPIHCDALRNSDKSTVYKLNTTNFSAIPDTTSARHCLNSPSPCEALTTTWTCTRNDTVGGNPQCDPNAFSAIVNKMSRLASGLDEDDVTITYQDSQFGQVNGPVVPLITVTIEQHPFTIRTLFANNEDQELPPVGTTIIGEGLGSGKSSQLTCS